MTEERLRDAYVKFSEYTLTLKFTEVDKELLEQLGAMSDAVQLEMERMKLVAIEHDLDPDCSCSTCMEVARITQMYI